MNKLFPLLIILAFAFSSCNTTKVIVDYDPQADFSQYKTFSYVPWNKQSDEILSERDKNRFRAATTFELEKLGFVKGEGKTDLAINLFLIIDQKTGTSTYNDFYSSGPTVGYYLGPWGYNNPGGVSVAGTMHSYDYEEGTLIVDLLDVKKKQLAWQGIAKKTIKSKNKGNGDGSGIKLVMEKLFKDFPLEATK